MCAKNYKNWWAVDKVIAETSRLTFLAHPVVQSAVLQLHVIVVRLSVCLSVCPWRW